MIELSFQVNLVWVSKMIKIDRYTWWRWKESYSDLKNFTRQQLAALWIWCNSSIRNRAISLFFIALLVIAISFVLKSFKSSPQIAVSKEFVVSKTDENGDTWTLDFLKGQNFQDISNSKTQLGPPLTLKADTKRNSDYICLDFFIVGNGGEKYIPVPLKNNRWQSPPTIEVKNNEGTIIHTGTFQFGGAGLCPYYLRIPTGFKGKLTFELKTNFGPFSVRKEPVWIEI
jgi:hypothetical protein